MATTMKKPMLSKSTFVRGCKCLKSLHLYKHHYDLRDEISTSQQALFDQGHEVGAYARQLFPAGYDCSVVPAVDYTKLVEKTKAAIDSGAKVLYEAGFMFNNVYAAIDILVIKRNRFYIYEVKSSTEVKDYHYLDASIQFYILNGLGFSVKAVHVVTINRDYVRMGSVEPQKLFGIHDVTKDVLEQQAVIHQQLPIMLNVIAGDATPNMQIGPQCSKFFDCDFHGHCWQMFDNVEFPVHTIKRLAPEKLCQLLDKRILCQSQVPVTFPLSVHQRTQVWANKTKQGLEPDVRAIRDFLSRIKEPVAFLDFETFSSAVPLFDGIRPYQQVPFQYSVHVLQNEQLQHFEFLGDGKSDPRCELVENLLPTLQGAKTILCYNMNFEKLRLEELRDTFPSHAKALQKIIDKLVDLIIPFRNKYVYHYKMDGSASLKSVLPAFIPHLSYDHLEIGDGGTASQAYLNLFNENNAAKVDITRSALLQYCQLDTYAMVALWRYLKNVSAPVSGGRLIKISF